MLTSWCTVLLSFGVLLLPGVLCQSFTPPTGEICPGDDVTFTCSAGAATFWTVSPGGADNECSYRNSNPIMDMCGPERRFTSGPTDVNGDNTTSFLSVDSITGDLNGTLVECDNSDGDLIGSGSIFIVDSASAPQILSARVSESDVCDDNGCVVTVEWSEPFISSADSVSQYVLSVTPPTPECPTGSDSGDSCMLMTVQTQYKLTLAMDQMYTITVRADTCDNTVTGNSSDPISVVIYDGTQDRSALPQYDMSTGILETVTLNWGAFVLQTNGGSMITNVTYDYTVSLSSPVYLGPDGGQDVTEVTSDLSHTFTVSRTAIAEYNPVLMVNVPGSREVAFPSSPILSELEADDGVVSVDVTSSCYSSVVCSPMEPIDECTAYCGVSGNIEDLTNSGSNTELVNGVITIRLPPATGTSYHCVVTGSRDDGSIVFRGRQQQTVSGCPVDNLLPNAKGPDCVTADDGLCSCTLSRDGRYGLMYNSNSPGSIAKYFIGPNYCFKGSEKPTRVCQASGSWTREELDDNDIREVSPYETLNSWNITLIVLGGIFLALGLALTILQAVWLFKRVKDVSWTVTIKKWPWTPVGISAAIELVVFCLWLAVNIYPQDKKFAEGGFSEDGYRRLSDSRCADLASNVVKNTLVLISFLLCLLVLIFSVVFFVIIILWKYGVSTNVKVPAKPKRKLKTKTEEEQQLSEMYDTLNHGKSSSSPQPLLSQTNPDLYGKLSTNKEKDQPEKEDAPHYGKLDRGGKSQKEDAPHYGKLDRGKGSTLPATIATIPPHSDSEYGKLDHSTMESTPHYGRLDQKAGTLPGTVPPGDQYADPNTIEHQAGPSGALYAMPQQGKRKGKKGKKEEAKSEGSHMQVVSSGQTGDVYDTVTNEPRFKPRLPSGQPGEEGSLL